MSQTVPCEMSGHDDWDLYSNPQEMDKMRNRAQELEEELAHSNWHNAVYLAALGSVDGGLEASKEMFCKASKLVEPLCKECEKGYLLPKLKEKDDRSRSLQRQLSPPSPILCNDAIKRSRLNSFQDQSK